MSRVLRSVRKRKKGCTLGAVDVIDREGYTELEVDAKVELIRSLVPLGLLHIEELLDEEVTALVGERYARKDPSVGGRRHGSNPGDGRLDSAGAEKPQNLEETNEPKAQGLLTDMHADDSRPNHA